MYISNLSGQVVEKIKKENAIDCPRWSPDGKYIAFSHGIIPPIQSIIILEFSTKEEKIFPIDGDCHNLCWSPDSKLLCYLGVKSTSAGAIRLIDIQKEKFSDPLDGIKPMMWAWATGLAWSPDGKYIIYSGQVDSTKGNVSELCAVRIDHEKLKTVSSTIPITNSGMFGYPAHPTFSDNGKIISYSLFSSNSDIYSVPISIENLKISGELTEISTFVGEDNDPYWTKDEEIILYSSNKDGQWDVYEKNYVTKIEKRVTFSKERERFPKTSPDGQFIVFLNSGKLYRLPREGGKIEQISPQNLKLGMGFDFLPDEKHIISLAKGDTSFLVQFNINDQSYKMLEEVSPLSDFRASPNGKYVVAASGPLSSPDSTYLEWVFLLDLETNEKRYISTQSIWFPRGNFSWSGDSRYIIHDKRHNDTLVYELIDMNDFTIKELKMELNDLPGEKYVKMLHPNGEKILITTWVKEANLCIWEGN